MKLYDYIAVALILLVVISTGIVVYTDMHTDMIRAARRDKRNRQRHIL